jgi:hypothetical protein
MQTSTLPRVRVELPGELHAVIAQLAEERGQPVARQVVDLLLDALAERQPKAEPETGRCYACSRRILANLCRACEKSMRGTRWSDGPEDTRRYR